MAEKSRRDGGFTRVPDGLPAALLAKHISANEMAVLLELMRYQDSNNTFWRPREDVADALGFTDGYVRNMVSSMKKKGIIRQVDGGHKGKAAVYALTL